MNGDVIDQFKRMEQASRELQISDSRLLIAAKLLAKQNGWNEPLTREDALLLSKFIQRFIQPQVIS